MCGLFGFVGAGPVNPEELGRCARAARRRGPDSIGAWLAGDTGEDGDRLGERIVGVGAAGETVLQRIVKTAVRRRTTWVVGHCRLSPDQSWRDPGNAQPLLFGFGALAHNGNLRSGRALEEARGLGLSTQVDSEIVGRLVEIDRAEDPPSAFSLIDSGAPAAWLALYRGTFLAFRRRHPLSVTRHEEGFYFASDTRRGETLAPERWHRYQYP